MTWHLIRAAEPAIARRRTTGGAALELLRLGTQQPHARFRPGQEEAIRHIDDGRHGPLLLVQKTGWGKSNVYFIAAKLLREKEKDLGPTLLVSPLLSLMRNQIEAAERMGVRAKMISFAIPAGEKESIEEDFRRGKIDVLLITPERLSNEKFNEEVLVPMADRIALLVIDEAHCISDWGHDFRPDYRRIERVVRTLPQNLRILTTTATANDRVVNDLRDVLGPEVKVSRGDLNRPSLLLQTLHLPDQAERLAWLAQALGKVRGSGIIYTLTIRDAEQVAEWLRSRGFDVEAYTADIEDSKRKKLEQKLLKNHVKALAATVALGMGFDKPDLAFVFHYQAPGSVIHYYQQVGRAGRALNASHGVLLSGDEDTDITDYFINSAFPSRCEVEKVLDALDQAPDGLSLAELAKRVKVPDARIGHTLKLLSIESPAPIVREGPNWQLVAVSLSGEFWKRVERLTELRRCEQKQMQRYVDLEAGHMEFLIEALNGNSETVTPPQIEPLPTCVDGGLVCEAVAYLRRTSSPIEPRKQWPGGKKIAEDLRAAPGRALSLYRDAGWGELVYQGKYRDGRFADELVDACKRMVRAWHPEPVPTWVTAIPSWGKPELVPGFARRLARALDLEFHDVLQRTADVPEQKEMENNYYKARNAYKSLVVQNEPPSGPVLLVDDIVYSRWTMTVAAYRLRSNGSGEVFPLALSLARGGV